MRTSLGRLSSAVLELLLPSARAQACTPAYCVENGSRHRCCINCSGGVVTCSGWTTGICKSNTCL